MYIHNNNVKYLNRLRLGPKFLGKYNQDSRGHTGIKEIRLT